MPQPTEITHFIFGQPLRYRWRALPVTYLWGATRQSTAFWMPAYTRMFRRPAMRSPSTNDRAIWADPLDLLSRRSGSGPSVVRRSTAAGGFPIYRKGGPQAPML